MALASLLSGCTRPLIGCALLTGWRKVLFSAHRAKAFFFSLSLSPSLSLIHVYHRSSFTLSLSLSPLLLCPTTTEDRKTRGQAPPTPSPFFFIYLPRFSVSFNFCALYSNTRHSTVISQLLCVHLAARAHLSPASHAHLSLYNTIFSAFCCE